MNSTEYENKNTTRLPYGLATWELLKYMPRREFLVYTFIRSKHGLKKGGSFYSQEEIGKVLGYSRLAVNEAFRWLRNRHIIWVAKIDSETQRPVYRAISPLKVIAMLDAGRDLSNLKDDEGQVTEGEFEPDNPGLVLKVPDVRKADSRWLKIKQEFNDGHCKVSLQGVCGNLTAAGETTVQKPYTINNENQENQSIVLDTTTTEKDKAAATARATALAAAPSTQSFPEKGEAPNAPETTTPRQQAEPPPAPVAAPVPAGDPETIEDAPFPADDCLAIEDKSVQEAPIVEYAFEHRKNRQHMPVVTLPECFGSLAPEDEAELKDLYRTYFRKVRDLDPKATWLTEVELRSLRREVLKWAEAHDIREDVWAMIETWAKENSHE